MPNKDWSRRQAVVTNYILYTVEMFVSKTVDGSYAGQGNTTDRSARFDWMVSELWPNCTKLDRKERVKRGNWMIHEDSFLKLPRRTNFPAILYWGMIEVEARSEADHHTQQISRAYVSCRWTIRSPAEVLLFVTPDEVLCVPTIRSPVPGIHDPRRLPLWRAPAISSTNRY